jgi:hypothetical protein
MRFKPIWRDDKLLKNDVFQYFDLTGGLEEYEIPVPKVIKQFWKGNRLGTRTTNLLLAS